LAVHYDKDTNSTITWIDKIKNALKGISSEADKTFKQLFKLDEVDFNKLQENNFKDFIEENKLADKSLIRFLEDADIDSKSLESYQQYLKDTGQATLTFTDFTQKAIPVLKSFSASMMSIGVNWLISEAIGAATITFGNLINTS
jgi:hypothetical protein